MSMAHGLEVRVPFLDHKLAEYVVALPDNLKLTLGASKPLLVRSLPGLLPTAITRRRKQGFTLPFDAWMRGPLRQFCQDRLGQQGLGGREMFNPIGLAQIWDDFIRRKPNVTWSRVWLLVALEEWLVQQRF
jgi:asparagine synthase (glutamine-hydrolysing)